MKNCLLFTFVLSLLGLQAQTGPGGVGSTANNVLWLDANRGITLSGSNITNWADQSGNGFNAVPPSAAAQPVISNNSVNNYPAIQFDGTNDEMRVTDNNKLDLTQWHFFVVPIVTVSKDCNAWFIKGDDAAENYEVMSSTANQIHTPIKFTDGTRTFVESAGGQVTTTGFNLIEYSYSSAVGRDSYKNYRNIYTDNESKTPLVNAMDLYIANEKASTGRFVNGKMAEIIMYNAPLNKAQRIIVNNYLGAKYNVSIDTVDIYVQDNPGNGNYDHEVAGIGRVDASNIHNDAQGSGIVRILNPGGLDNNEFLFWGHDNASLTFNQFTDIPAGMHARTNRVWRVNEVNALGTAVNVGSIEIRFNLSGLGNFKSTDLRLLIDTDNDGVFTDETGISGATALCNGIFAFTGVTGITNNSRFTIARRFAPDLFVKGNAGVTNFGTSISIWNDYSGKNNHLTQCSAGNQPLSDTTNLINFNPSVQFASAKYMNSDSNAITSGTTESSFYAVAYPTGNIKQNPIVAQGTNLNYFETYLSSTSIGIGISNTKNDTFPFTHSLPTAPKLGRWSLNDNSLYNTINMFVNGLQIANTSADVTAINNPKNITYIGSTVNGNTKFSNVMCEFIHYPFTLTTIENSLIQSYLAIKWGITLSQSASTNHYINSSFVRVWDASIGNTNNTKYRIAGIGRDDAMALYQKQSRSQEDIDANVVVTMGIGSIAARNTNNANVMNDGSFLVWADDSAAISEQTTEMPIAIFGSSTCGQGKRLSREWMVQRTGTMPPVQIRMNINNAGINGRPLNRFKLAISNSKNFTGAAIFVNATSFTNGVLTFDNVTFSDTDAYFTVITDTTMNYGPANVSSSLRMWLRADKGINLATGVSKWEDQSNSGNNAIQNTAANQPAYKNNSTDNINFNPVVDFSSASAHRMTFPTNTLNAGSGDFAIYSVTKRSTATQGSIIAFGTAAGNTGFYAGFVNTGQHMYNTTTGTYYPNTGISPFNTSMLTKFAQYGSNKRRVNTNGRLTGLDSSLSINITQASAFIGSGISGSYYFDGKLAELIVYQTDPSGINESKIQSYLAVKYGLTIDQTTPTNYVASNGTVVWNATTHAAYKSRIFGIGYDACSGLLQKQSRSILDSNGVLTMSLNTMAASNIANTGSFTNDSTYIMLGDNNAAMTENNADLPSTISSCSKRMAREWKADITGIVVPVELRFNLNTVTISGSVANDFKLLIDNDGDGNFTTGTVTTINATSYAGKMLTFSNVTLGDGQVITIVTKVQSTGTVGLTPANSELTTSTYCSKNGWVNIYDPADSNKRLFAVYPNGNTFSPMNIKINTGLGFNTADLNKADRLANKAITLMQRMVQVFDATGGNDTINGGMIVKFYYNPAEKTDAQNRMTKLRADSSITGNTSWNWFKSEKTISAIISQMTGAGIGGPSRVWITNPDSSGTEDGVTFAEFRNITEIATFGGGQISGGNWNILPVKLLEFKASKRNTESVLDWTTASEKNASHFVVERSLDAKSWSTIGTVQASGNTITTAKYQFVDAQPLSGLNYYRLNTIDFDATAEYSKIVRVDYSDAQNINIAIYPNSVVESLTIETTMTENHDMQILISNTLGEIVYQDAFVANAKTNSKTIQRDMAWTPGVYWIRVTDATTGMQETKQLHIK